MLILIMKPSLATALPSLRVMRQVTPVQPLQLRSRLLVMVILAILVRVMAQPALGVVGIKPAIPGIMALFTQWLGAKGLIMKVHRVLLLTPLPDLFMFCKTQVNVFPLMSRYQSH